MSVGKVRFMSDVTSRARVQHNSHLFWWLERGDVGFSNSAQVDELHFDARSKVTSYVPAREDGEHDAAITCRRLHQLQACLRVEKMVQR